MTDLRRIDEEIELVRDEIADIERQVAAGDLDPATATSLRERSTTRLAALERQRSSRVAAGDGAKDEATDPTAGESAMPEASERSRVSGRAIVGAAIVGIAITAIAVFAVASLDDGASAGAEGVVGDVVAGEGGVDLSEITNEQMEEVVAQNPDVIGMRLALARRYFEEGTFDRALDHYFEILDREQHPEALANVGWMTYLSQRPDVAVGYLEAALVRQPDYLPAQWFISNVYVTLGREAEAVPFLVGIIGTADVPAEIRESATTLLEQIEGSP